MRRAASAAVLCALVAAASAHAQPPVLRDAFPVQKPATIRGRVFVDGTDEPVRKARVALTNDSGASPPSTYSDADGRFEFDGLAAGRYTASAWKSGFVELKFGARTSWDRAVPIVVPAGAIVDRIDIPLPRGAAIVGRVVDDGGQPLSNVSVSASRLVTVDRHVRLDNGADVAVDRPRFKTSTDDLGEYRLGGLPAGSYVVSAFGWPGPARGAETAATISADAAVRMGGPRLTFFPQTGVLSQARPIAVRSGEESSGTDLVLSGGPVRVAVVSGRVLDPTGRAGRADVAAGTDGAGIPEAATGRFAPTRAGGEFSMPLDPGDYILNAESDGSAAAQRLVVGESDISDVQLVLAKTARLAGRIVFEGAAPSLHGALLVEAWSAESLSMIGRRNIVPANRAGAFEIADLFGQRQLRLLNPPPGWTVKSITIGGRDVLDQPIELKGEDIANATIVLAPDASVAELRGTVLDVDRRPATAASVIVFADDPRQLPRRAYWQRPDTSGEFIVHGLASGEYFVALVDDVDDTQWSSPEWLNRLRPKATRVTVAAGEKKSIALRWDGPR